MDRIKIILKEYSLKSEVIENFDGLKNDVLRMLAGEKIKVNVDKRTYYKKLYYYKKLLQF